MEWLILAVVVAAVMWLWNRDMAKARRTGKRPGGNAGGAFAVMNELFQPNAHEVSIIQEAEKEAAVEIPGAPDPLHPGIKEPPSSPEETGRSVDRFTARRMRRSSMRQRR